MTWRGGIRTLADIDWSTRPHLYLMAALVVVSRFPFLNNGFGWDGDAWLVALRAYDLRNSGVYVPSRFPGYPLHEYTNALLIDMGWIGTNGATLVFSVVAVLAFALVLKQMNCRNKGLMVLCFAFMPILWKNGAITMDYMWTISFVLLSWLFTLRKTYWAAGVMIGLAVGTRPSSAIMLLPFAYLMWTMRPMKTDVALYYAAAVSIPALLFTPLYMDYGFGFLTYYQVEASPLTIPVRIARVTGAIPLLFVGAVAAYKWRALVSAAKARDRTNVFLATVMVLHAIMFIRIPFEPEYWIPAVPFAMVLFARLAGRREMTVLLVLLVSAAFINPDVTLSLDSDEDMVFSYDGIVLREWVDREDELERAQMIMDLDIPDHSAMILGRYAWIVAYLDDDLSCDPDSKVMLESDLIHDFDKDIIVAYGLTQSQVEAFISDGRTVYYLPEWEYFTMDGQGFSLAEEGCIQLDV